MFEHFTFGAAPHPSTHQLLLDDDAFPSPTDTSCPSAPTPPGPSSFPFPAANPGINDIVAKFSQHSLQQQQQQSRSGLPIPTSHPSSWQIEVDDDEDEEMTMSLPLPLPLPPPAHRISQPLSPPPTSLPFLSSTTGFSSASRQRRLQRQLAAQQLQTCASHVRDIGALVEGMIASEAQCTLRTSPPAASSRGGKDREKDDDAVAMMMVVMMDTQGRSLLVDPRELEVDDGFGYGDFDEGFHDGDEDIEREAVLVDGVFGGGGGKGFGDEEGALGLRRASAPSGVRKCAPSGLRYGRSADVAVGSGRAKVRSLPRMRRRGKVARVPE